MKTSLFRKVVPTLFIFVFFSLVFVPVHVSAQDGVAKKNDTEITVEWIYSPESRKTFMLPEYRWLTNGMALLYDSRVDEAKRNFELMNPRNGKRKPYLDMQKALESLRTFLGEEKCPKVLPWPNSWDKESKKALYRFQGDIFLLDFPLATFQRITQTEEPETGALLSPDGKKIAYVRKYDVYIYDTETQKEKAVTSGGSEELLNGALSDMYVEDVFYRQEAGLWWSPDSNALAYLQSDVSAIGKLYYTDIKPYFPRIILQRYPVVGAPISKVRLGIVETNGKETGTTWVRLERGDADYYIVHVDWLPKGRRVAVQVQNRLQDQIDLYFADRFSGLCEHILKESEETWVNVSDDLYFLNDGKHFIWGSERDGYKHLYRYTLDGKLVNQITKGEWAVRGPFQYSFWSGNSVVSIDEKRQQLYFTSLEKSSLERHLYRINFDGTGMQRITKEDGFHSVTFSLDGKYYFDVYSNTTTAPCLFLHHRNGKRLGTTAKAYSHLLEKYDIQYPQLMTVPADDGFPMPAQMWKPKDFDPNKKYPVIIYHYGGPSAPLVADSWNPRGFFNQVLLRNGYLCFSVDNRSAAAISKKYEKTIFKQMVGENEVNDLLAAVKWLKAQPYVDPDRVGIWGWSYGACFTLSAMTRSKEFRAGIAVAPVTDQRFHSPKWSEFSMKTEKENAEGYKDVSLVDRARDLHGRLLLVHGSYDDNVRIQNTWSFVDRLVAAGIQFDLMVYPMRKHGISDPPARIHLFNKMVEFWKKNL